MKYANMNKRHELLNLPIFYWLNNYSHESKSITSKPLSINRYLYRICIIEKYNKKPTEKKLEETSCTVSVVTGKYKVSITISCTCTRRQACDKAYAVAGFLL
jgi:hypothetical protein